jgi:hypothetical protein
MKEFNWPFRFRGVDENWVVSKHSAAAKRHVGLVSLVAWACACLLGL